MSSVVAPLLHAKVYGAVPPLTVRSTEPLLAAHAAASVGTAPATRVLPGCATVALAVCVQPLASVMVTLYVPAPRPLMSSVVAPLLHTKVYGAVPPLTVRSTDPLLVAHAAASVGTAPATRVLPGCATVALAVCVQPLAAVIVTLYVPALRRPLSSVV